MANFDNGVSSPNPANYAAPLMNFTGFGDWSALDPNEVKRKQQQQQLNDQTIQQNQQRLTQGQRQQQLAEAFQSGGALDEKGNFDPKKAQSLFARFGVLDGITQVAPMIQQQQAANTPLYPATDSQGGGPRPSVQGTPASPRVAGQQQGDAPGSVISRVTDLLPPDRLRHHADQAVAAVARLVSRRLAESREYRSRAWHQGVGGRLHSSSAG